MRPRPPSRRGRTRRRAAWDARHATRSWVQSVDPADFGFAAPADGVLTRLTMGLYRVNAPGGKLTLEVVRPGGAAGVYEVVGTDERDAGAPTTARQMLTFDTRLAVKAGDRLGVHTEGPVEAAADGVSPGQVIHGTPRPLRPPARRSRSAVATAERRCACRRGSSPTRTATRSAMSARTRVQRTPRGRSPPARTPPPRPPR